MFKQMCHFYCLNLFDQSMIIHYRVQTALNHFRIMVKMILVQNFTIQLVFFFKDN